MEAMFKLQQLHVLSLHSWNPAVCHKQQLEPHHAPRCLLLGSGAHLLLLQVVRVSRS
jgi:hypothetical protein